MSRLKLYSSKLFALEDFEDSDVAILPDEQQAKNMAEVQENLNMIETASDTMNTVIEDSHLTENIAEIVEDAAEAGEGVSETAVTLIQEAVESIYRRHGMPKRYYPEIPSLEAYEGNRIKAAKAIHRRLKVSVEDGILEALKKIWESIKEFFSKIWDSITGNSSSNEDKANDLQKRIKKLMDDKKDFPASYASSETDKDKWFKFVNTTLKESNELGSSMASGIDSVLKKIQELSSNKDANKDLLVTYSELLKPALSKIDGVTPGDYFNDKNEPIPAKFDELLKTKANELFDSLGDEIYNDVETKSKSTSFPKGTGWQDLYDLAGNINKEAKGTDKDLTKLKESFKEFEPLFEEQLRAINENKEMQAEEKQKAKEQLGITKNILLLSTKVAASGSNLHKRLLDLVEKAVKEGEK